MEKRRIRRRRKKKKKRYSHPIRAIHYSDPERQAEKAEKRRNLHIQREVRS